MRVAGLLLCTVSSPWLHVKPLFVYIAWAGTQGFETTGECQASPLPLRDLKPYEHAFKHIFFFQLKIQAQHPLFFFSSKTLGCMVQAVLVKRMGCC